MNEQKSLLLVDDEPANIDLRPKGFAYGAVNFISRPIDPGIANAAVKAALA